METFMILTICITFLCTSILYAAILFLAFRRVGRHLQGNAAAIAVVTEHVLVPLFGSKALPPNEDSEVAG
jgi:hypothetical protein